MAVSDPKNDALAIVGIIIVLFIAWIATGGPNKEKRTGLVDAVLESRATTTSTSSPRLINRRSSRSTGGVSRTISRQSVSLGGSSSAARTDEDEEYITIKAYSGSRTPVNITGWQLRSLSNGSFYIPQAVGALHVGRVNLLGPVELLPGDQAIVTSGRSPIGVSFRVNKCSGYLEQFQDFTPSLPTNCPHPKDNDERELVALGLTDVCIDYILKLPRCQVPIKKIPSYFSYRCKDYIMQAFNYNNCIQKHQNDKDFYKKEWRIFLGSNNELWRSRRESIFLFDSNNQLVDTLRY